MRSITSFVSTMPCPLVQSDSADSSLFRSCANTEFGSTSTGYRNCRTRCVPSCVSARRDDLGAASAWSWAHDTESILPGIFSYANQ
ncbi:hypothetical protein BD309DRAFT_972181 [Dichomitus squalens]|nr:hypothetical protein BD309DRAFT_972181 [Dichomitus squalens]